MKKYLTFVLLLLGTSFLWAGSPRVIAHRGYWNISGAAQNSIKSLENADSIKCYGSEFDVWLAADGKLVVNHDNSYDNCPMETSTSKQLLRLKLANGETLPSLKAYLDKGKQLKTKLILELKQHKDTVRETAAVEQIMSMVKKNKLVKRVEYITFSRHAMKELIRMKPSGTPVYYLSGDLSPKELKDMGASGADYNLGVFKKHPEWIKELHDLGLRVNVWTVNAESDMRWCISKGVDFITTNEPVLLQSLLKTPSQK